MKKKNKLFVIDTNVILHDFNSIYNFQDNDVAIPITVLEELDKFKKGGDLINFHAREFMREIDKLFTDKIFKDGISLGEGKGQLYIITGKTPSPTLHASFPEEIPDHRILAVAEFLSINKKEQNVVLVSQDINLRMKAKALGLQAEDYKTGKVKDIDNFHKLIPEIDNVNSELINAVYQSKTGIPVAEFKLTNELKANQYLILKSETNTVLARYCKSNKTLEKVEKGSSYGISPKNAEQTFAMDALLNPDIQLITLTGKAGTGKTLLALAAALQQSKRYNCIYLARPIIPLANKDIGFLPGDAKSKIEPYMAPLFDNLSVIKHKFSSNSPEYLRIEEMIKTEKLVITPLAYIRGRSLANAFFIVDEAQNLTPHEVKTIITRAGDNTKMVFTGDIFQIDSPYLDMKSNGLSYLSDKMIGQNVFAHVNLVKGERSPLAELASDLL